MIDRSHKIYIYYLTVSACVKTLAVDKDEDPLIEFYKARVNYFYSGSVEEVEFDQLDSNMRSVINQMVTMKTREKVQDFMYHDHLPKYLPPMISFGANFLQVICHNSDRSGNRLRFWVGFWSFVDDFSLENSSKIEKKMENLTC